MTRGGKRKPVGGRPKSTGETRTANLCGIRVRPSQLASYKEAALRSGMSLSGWVQHYLDKATIGSGVLLR